MTEAPILDRPPFTERMNAYDEQLLSVYLRLLMAEEEGADWREVASVLLRVDATKDTERAKSVYDSHLARARWMTEAGYRDLLKAKST